MERKDESALLESIHKIAESLDNGPIKQVPIAKYAAQTPWNPTGDKRRPTLRRTVYMSGSRLREQLLSNEEIRLLNQIKPGKYNDRRWLVIETDGGDAEGGAITILIPNRTPEDRVRLKGEAHSLTALLTKIIEEQQANDPAVTRKAAPAPVEATAE